MKYLSAAVATGLLLTSSMAIAQNFTAGSFPSYTDTLLNNADSYDVSLGGSLQNKTTDGKLTGTYQAAVENLKARNFTQASALFDAYFVAPRRIAEPSPSKLTYYMAGASHYHAGNDDAALPLLKRSLRSGCGLNPKQQAIAKSYVADILAR
ncbi:hypothetical protein [Sphingorhabdus sp. Alg231-15]|uniref:hypothetical protein n=1 Tax=Sphingorhabdus sp. Alg231-15 TaxID=1922222 RepID=UPI000D54CAF1